MKSISIQSIQWNNDMLECALHIGENKEFIITDFEFEGGGKSIITLTKETVVTDRIDAYVWGLMTLAMSLGMDIESEIPISKSLYYNLEYHFIDSLSYHNAEWRRIHIKAPLMDDVQNNQAHIVATGISCGIDSLYTIATHTDSNTPDSHTINTLAFFNAGASYYPDQPLRSDLVNARIDMARHFARDYGYNFLFVESNLPQIIAKYHAYSHVENHTYMMLFCTYMLQGSIDHYYYSSGYSYDKFSFNAIAKNHGDAAYYDLFTLSMASIGNLKYHSTGGSVTRFEKTKALVDYTPAQRYLNVCVRTIVNCCTCYKCIRTIFSLEALGATDKFSSVFDFKKFNSNRNFWLKELYYGATYGGDLFSKEIAPYFGNEFTLGIKIRAAISALKNFVFRKNYRR